MPTRGYRKGKSDCKEPLSNFVRTRLSDPDFDRLVAEAYDRNMTVSKLTRVAVVSYLTGQRTQIPHNRPNTAVLRELGRIGNNLNQLARHANTGTLPVSEGELRDCINHLNDLARAFG